MGLIKRVEFDVIPEEVDIGFLIRKSPMLIARRYLEESYEKGKAIRIKSFDDYLGLKSNGYKVAAQMGGRCKIFKVVVRDEVVRYVAFIPSKSFKDG